VTFKVRGSRRSGTPNTSVGNSIINALVHAFILSKSAVDYRMIVLGDDNLVCMDHSEEVKLQLDIFGQLGLKAVPKLVKAGEEHMIEFCSSRFWPLEENRYILGPKIGRAIAKLCWFIRPPVSTDDQMTMLRGTILSRYCDFSYLPILNTLAQKLLHHTRKSGVVSEARVTHKLLAVEMHDCTDTVMKSACLQYGFTNQQFSEIEKCVEGIVDFPCVINHPLLDYLVEFDK